MSTVTIRPFAPAASTRFSKSSRTGWSRGTYKLEPGMLGDRGGDLLDRGRRGGAEHKGNVRIRRGARERQVGARPGEVVQACRRDAEGQVVVAAEEAGAQLAFRDIDQIARHDADVVEGACGCARGLFRPQRRRRYSRKRCSAAAVWRWCADRARSGLRRDAFCYRHGLCSGSALETMPPSGATAVWSGSGTIIGR